MSDLNIPIYLRTQEVEQVQRMARETIADLTQADLDERVEDLTSVYTEHLEGLDIEPRESEEWATYASMPADDWWSLVRAFGRLDGLDAWWLRKKLAGRLRDRLDQLED